MKLYDLCIIQDNPDYQDLVGNYAIIIEDYDEYFLMEIWTFSDKRENRILGIFKKYLRKATKEEEEEYLKKFNEYCKDYL
ncbi:hypothetical protein ACI76O_11440 [Capnocytophaga cynodegmi]|uniref:hypothetical protein n=1 Tax=Capnocytophaga cynodegmi TaxID=28189 RepID=UPI00385D0D7E